MSSNENNESQFIQTLTPQIKRNVIFLLPFKNGSIFLLWINAVKQIATAAGTHSNKTHTGFLVHLNQINQPTEWVVSEVERRREDFLNLDQKNNITSLLCYDVVS